MSWKSLVTAGLLCVLASPAFANPSLQVSSGGLNAAGDWVWNVSITPTAAGTPLAGEMGFSATGAGLVSATRANPPWENDNPGVKIFGWETDTDVDPGPATNNRPVGLQTNTTVDQVFAALGSNDSIPAGATQYVQIITEGPRTTSLTSTIAVSGKHGTGGTNGRIAEITGTTATNYSNFTGSATRTAFVGDINLDGNFNFSDVAAFSPNFGKAATNGWVQGDWNRDGNTNFTDVATMSPNFGKAGGANTPLNVAGLPGGSGAASGGGVPEPASVALAGLAILAGLGFTIRKRQQ